MDDGLHKDPEWALKEVKNTFNALGTIFNVFMSFIFIIIKDVGYHNIVDAMALNHFIEIIILDYYCNSFIMLHLLVANQLVISIALLIMDKLIPLKTFS